MVVYSDPYNTSSFKSVPGVISAYTLRLTNSGPGAVDANTVIISDPLPAEVDLYVDDIGGAGIGPVVFTDGSPASGLGWTFTALNNNSEDRQCRSSVMRASCRGGESESS